MVCFYKQQLLHVSVWSLWSTTGIITLFNAEYRNALQTSIYIHTYILNIHTYIHTQYTYIHTHTHTHTWNFPYHLIEKSAPIYHIGSFKFYVQWGKKSFDPLLILYVCPLTKRWSVYNFNGRFIWTVRNRITTRKSRKMHLKKVINWFAF